MNKKQQCEPTKTLAREHHPHRQTYLLNSSQRQDICSTWGSSFWSVGKSTGRCAAVITRQRITSILLHSWNEITVWNKWFAGMCWRCKSKGSGRCNALARTKGDPVWWQQVLEWFFLHKRQRVESLCLYFYFMLFTFFFFFFTCLHSIDLNGFKWVITFTWLNPSILFLLHPKSNSTYFSYQHSHSFFKWFVLRTVLLSP